MDKVTDTRKLERLLRLIARWATQAKEELILVGDLEAVQDELSGIKDLLEEAEGETLDLILKVRRNAPKT